MNESPSTTSDSRDRGRRAWWPSQIPLLGWKDVMLRVWTKINEDRVLLVAAGATFYLLLALFPALTAFVSTYGLFADPLTVTRHVADLESLLPDGLLGVVADRLESLATQEASALGIGFLVGLVFSYWSANNGVKTLFEALNIAYRETEKRSFIHLNLLSLVFTIGIMAALMVMVVALGLIPVVIEAFPFGFGVELLLEAARWLLLIVVVLAGIALLYRHGPSRTPARWRWVSWGSVFATVVWVLASVGFSYYLQNFADYEATYGSLGAVIGFMMWTWISVIILIVGAEINAEVEHQTARDSTTGRARPMGERGAVVADTLGETAQEQ